MQLPVSVNAEPRLVECDFATVNDVKIIALWTRIPKSGDNTMVQDAAEFAGLACKRWRFYRRAGRFAQSLPQLRDIIARDPQAEVALLLAIRAPWHRPDPQLGVCLSRRTWSNNLCLDFLAVDPRLKRSGATAITGLAIGLLYYVCAVGKHLQSAIIWGESTPLSAGFYRHQFGVPDITDFFHLNLTVRSQFQERTVARWQTSGLALQLQL